MKTSLKILFLLSLFSCASVDRAKYEKFSNSVELLDSQMDEAARVSEFVSRESEIAALATRPDAKLAPYFITSTSEWWKMGGTPLYLEFRRARLQLAALNATFEGYLKLLVELAGGNIKDRSQLVSAGKELNSQSAALEKDFQMVTPVAMSAFESCLDGQREKFLQEAVVANQGAVEEFIRVARQMMQLQLEMLRKSYSNAFTGLSKEWRSGDRKALAREVLALNDSFITGHEFFMKIGPRYDSLSGLHKELPKKGESEGFSAALKGLSAEAARFNTLQKDLKGTHK